jgi:hypothetical protein
VPRHIHADQSNDDDSRAIACKLSRKLNWLRRFRRGRNHYAVGAASGRQSIASRERRIGIACDSVRAGPFRKLASIIVDVYSEYLAAGGLQELNRKLTYEAEADHRERLA